MALLGVLAAAPAQAIVITSGPTYAPGGGWTCTTPTAGSEKLAGGATYTCTGTAGAFSNLYIGIKNNNVPAGTVPFGEKMDSNGTTEPTGAAIFSWSADGATTIQYTGSTTITTFGTVFLRTTLTFTGTGSVVADATTIALSNANGAVHSLWRIAPSVSSMTVNALIEASTSASGPWTPARTFFGTTTTHRQGTDATDVDKSHVDLGFYVSTCGDGTTDSGFSAEQCDQGAANGTATSCCTATCQFRSAGQQCRASAGVCDVAETCTGSSATCPADGFLSGATVCRGAADVCDVAENCTGSSAACPADAFQSASTVCRAAAGVCDLAENCTGSGVTCPADAKSTAVCRAAVDICDATEQCDGIADDCPADAKQAAGTTCRAAVGICDIAETCDGSSDACPADALEPSSTTCRPSAGICDVAENCDGVSPGCPSDSLEPSSTVCRATAGACDVAENCTGSSVDCPTDDFEPSSTVCRAAAGVCDIAENCTGSSAACPTDDFEPSSTVCRSAAGICDLAESCTGSSASCPADTKDTAICRPATGACDVADACDGVTDSCPPDSVVGAFVECRASAGSCDVAEVCDGSSTQCPADGFLASSTVCRASADVCDVAENCTGTSAACPANAFQPSTVVCRAVANACDIAESCTGSSVSCPADQVAPDSDGDSSCDLVDNCPSVSNAGQGDADGDDIGDSCDPCTNALNIQTTRTKLIISKLLTPGGDDKLKYKGAVVVPTSPTLDMITKGARVIIADSLGSTILDATLPGGVFNPAQKAGWKGNFTASAFKYKNAGTVIPLVGGIQKLSVKKILSTPGMLKFAVSGKFGNYAVAPNRLPLTATIVFEGPIGSNNQCGDSRFPGPSPTPSCASTGGGNEVRCK